MVPTMPDGWTQRFNRLCGTLVQGGLQARTPLARMMRALRAAGERQAAKDVRGYAAWIGWPVR